MPELFESPTWKDLSWNTTFNRLPPRHQFALKESLRGLLSALKKCRNPRRDAELQAWLPSKWSVPRRIETRGDWVEYRLGDEENRARVIICFDDKKDIIYLVARTAIHDHTALRELVAKFK